MKAHLIDTHLLVPRSRSSTKVKVIYQGHVFHKMDVSGISVSPKHLVYIYTLQNEYFRGYPGISLSVCPSVCPFVCLCVRLYKILVSVKVQAGVLSHV